jgi:hypothetical protein
MKRVVVSALFGITLVTSAAQAQDRWEQVVRSQLTQVGAATERNGYHMATDIYQGRLDDNATTDLSVDLKAGKDYVLWGVCDQDCTDIDLVIYNNSGDQVDSDLQTDDKPLLHVIPPRDGKYRIKVTMVTCSANPCRYGVGLWSKDAGSAITGNSSGNSGNSSGGDQWESVVRSQLDRAGTVATDKGYAMSHEIFMGRLDDDGSESLNIPLDGGTQYILVGKCDQDCSDIDLTIYDPNGKEVDSDLETDDAPVLTLTAATSGQYRVKVSMVACTANPCRYGVGVWAK